MKKILISILILIITNTAFVITSFFVRLGVRNITYISISTYVPGKSPRDDGFPYIIGARIINWDENRCLDGYVNLITYKGQFDESICLIID